MGRTQQNTSVPTYGSYDLYLIYLSIPDLILNIHILIVNRSFANMKIPNIAYGSALVLASSTANLYINCVISYELLNLLRNSNNATRCRPPSLMKVTIQAMVVYVISILIFVAFFFTHKTKYKKYHTGNIDAYKDVTKINFAWSMILSVVIPTIFFCYVWITIWYRGYIKKLS